MRASKTDDFLFMAFSYDSILENTLYIRIEKYCESRSLDIKDLFPLGGFVDQPENARMNEIIIMPENYALRGKHLERILGVDLDIRIRVIGIDKNKVRFSVIGGKIERHRIAEQFDDPPLLASAVELSKGIHIDVLYISMSLARVVF